MAIVMICPHRDMRPWLDAFQRQAPELKVDIWPEVNDPDTVDFAVCWNQPAGALVPFANLKCISSLGAGVNHLLNDETLPADIPLTRIVDNDLKQSMAEYVVLAALDCFRHAAAYRHQQKQLVWQPIVVPHISTTTVGILGCGRIGEHVAEQLSALGFRVCCWNRTPKQVDSKITLYTGGKERQSFLAQVNILVCLLPLTAETEGILNLQLFKQLPKGAHVINVGRGKHLVEADLLRAFEKGYIESAYLDVFQEEPLPLTHPFWAHPQVIMTPHIASITNPDTAVRQILENYRRVKVGEPLLDTVDVNAGY